MAINLNYVYFDLKNTLILKLVFSLSSFRHFFRLKALKECESIHLYVIYI